MKAYSSDLCAKIAQACDEGAASRRQLARQFRVSVAFIQKMLRRRRLTGRLAAAAHTGGRRGLLDAEALALVTQLIREQNGLCRKFSFAHYFGYALPLNPRPGEGESAW
jgi:transposase